MQEVLLTLNQPEILLALFAGSIVLILIDYLFPVDWPAYFGYVLFAVFIGATVPLSVNYSLFSMLAVLSLMLTLHKAVFSKYLTNAPKHERTRFECEQSKFATTDTDPELDNGVDTGHGQDNGRARHVLR